MKSRNAALPIFSNPRAAPVPPAPPVPPPIEGEPAVDRGNVRPLRQAAGNDLVHRGRNLPRRRRTAQSSLAGPLFLGELVDRARFLEDVLLLDALGHDADAQRLGDALEPSVLAAAKRTTG